uniref:Uncharacterized protein n=1 Tax=Pristionchus pacificus TaxID=54126 RepID=A0A2A6CJ72_PRIPA|eukprot:PDM78252.1 hypothetical protein PRIPAC_30831 [Pristionchus pacificus]
MAIRVRLAVKRTTTIDRRSVDERTTPNTSSSQREVENTHANGSAICASSDRRESAELTQRKVAPSLANQRARSIEHKYVENVDRNCQNVQSGE